MSKLIKKFQQPAGPLEFYSGMLPEMTIQAPITHINNRTAFPADQQPPPVVLHNGSIYFPQQHFLVRKQGGKLIPNKVSSAKRGKKLIKKCVTGGDVSNNQVQPSWVSEVNIPQVDRGTISTPPTKWEKFKQRSGMITDAVADMVGFDVQENSQEQSVANVGGKPKKLLGRVGLLGTINSAPSIVGNLEQIKKALGMPYHQSLIDHKDKLISDSIFKHE